MTIMTTTAKKNVSNSEQKAGSDNDGRTRGSTRQSQLSSSFLVTLDSNLDEFAHHLAFLMAPHDLGEYVTPSHRSKQGEYRDATTNKLLTTSGTNGAVVNESSAVIGVDNDDENHNAGEKKRTAEANDTHPKKIVCKRRRVTFEDRVNGRDVNMALLRQQEQQQCTSANYRGTGDNAAVPTNIYHNMSSRRSGDDRKYKVSGSGNGTATDNLHHEKVDVALSATDARVSAEATSDRKKVKGNSEKRPQQGRLSASDHSSKISDKKEAIFNPAIISTAKHTDGEKTITTTTTTKTISGTITTETTLTKALTIVVAEHGRNDRIRYYPQVHQLLFNHKKALSRHNVFVYNTPLMYHSPSSNAGKLNETNDDLESYFSGTALNTGKRLMHVAYLDYEHQTSDIFCNRHRRRRHQGDGKEGSKHYYRADYYDTSSEEDDEDGETISDGSEDNSDEVNSTDTERKNDIESRSVSFDSYISRNRIQTFTCNAMQLRRCAVVILFLNNISFTDAITAFGSAHALNYCVLLSSNNMGVDALSLIICDMLRNMLQHGGKLWNIFSNRPYTCKGNKFILLNPYAYIEKM